MATFSVQFLGCKVSHVDAAAPVGDLVPVRGAAVSDEGVLAA